MSTYTVCPGDTLYEIAKRHNLSLEELYAMNPGVSAHVYDLQIGSVLNVSRQPMYGSGGYMTPPELQQQQQQPMMGYQQQQEKERGGMMGMFNNQSSGAKIAEGLLGSAAVVGLGAFAMHEWREHKRHDAATGQPAFMQYQSPMGYLCWRQVSGMIPQDAIQLGRDSDGAPLYAARVPLKGGWQVGKCRDADTACIPYGGKEMYIKSDIQVLCGPANAVTAVPQAGCLNLAGLTSMPLDSGHEDNGERLYVAVVDYKGSVQVGKCGPAMDGCNFSYGGREENMKSYRVVCLC
ncbi:hypothetical protein HDU83_001151 [Entophlyctis luteolus]|nr:hypothetical protein HDU82_005447 [Entophlyctis luteolus]KAJ3348609.1 hypothetical protein HDU83_001151 [Entophlyctis luteolus]